MAKLVEQYLTSLKSLVSQGGPEPEQDEMLSDTLFCLYKDLNSGLLSALDVAQIRHLMNFTPETMQGFAYLKPNGYAGCFEIIDRIYQRYYTNNPQMYNWDRYFHNQAAPQAVRNRKDYFIKLVNSILKKQEALTILNVASGPCRDVLELFQSELNLPLSIYCVEQDPRAIAYASKLCQPFLSKITFYQSNALRFSLQQKFDLIWSSGLFDYLHDGLFVKLLNRLVKHTKIGGQLVIGNFADTNSTRPYMELFDWQLFHRSPDDLRRLAIEAGFSHNRIEIRSEELGINLFLHLQRV